MNLYLRAFGFVVVVVLVVQVALVFYALATAQGMLALVGIGCAWILWTCVKVIYS